MTNNFATKKLLPATEKFVLCRIEPARYITDDLTIVSGTTYNMTFPATTFATGRAIRSINIPFIVSQIKVDGTAYTSVAGTTPSSAEYNYNETTRVLTINFGAAIGSKVVVAFYYLFYGQDEPKRAFQIPTDSTETVRQWFPRLRTPPSVRFNQRDIADGFFSSGSSSATLDNQDGFFQQYISNNDSFANKEIIFWVCFDDTENCQLLYKGMVQSLGVGNTVNIEVYDDFSSLDKTYYSNGTYLNSTYNATRFPNILPAHQNRPIYKLFCQQTHHYAKKSTGIEQWDVVYGDNLYNKFGSNYIMEAVCIDFEAEVTTSNNRNWGLHLAEGDFGSQLGSAGTSVDSTHFIYADATNVYNEGDYLFVAGSKYIIVLNVVDATKTIYYSGLLGAEVNAGETVFRSGVSFVGIEQDGSAIAQCWYNRDFTINSSGTNGIMQLIFNDNFEADTSVWLGGPMATLDPNRHKIYYIAYGDTTRDYEHGDVLKEVLEDADITVNAASVATANAAATLYTQFYIPYRDQEFPTYRRVAEDILKSTFGYITLNNSSEIEYHLFDTPAGSTTIDDRHIMKGSYSASIDYKQIITSLNPKNPQWIIAKGFDGEPQENNKARYLHGVEKPRDYNHVLTNIDRMDELLGFLSERNLRYNFATKTFNADSIIGDEFTIEKDNLPGSISTDEVKIVSIDKKPDRASIIAIDLQGV